jgi:hypothetical protein
MRLYADGPSLPRHLGLLGFQPILPVMSPANPLRLLPPSTPGYRFPPTRKSFWKARCRLLM